MADLIMLPGPEGEACFVPLRERLAFDQLPLLIDACGGANHMVDSAALCKTRCLEILQTRQGLAAHQGLP